MTKFVRVTAENGYHVTLEESYAKAEGLKPLKEEPCDEYGRPKAEAPGKTVAAPEADQTSTDESTAPAGSDDAASTQEETQ